MEKLIENLEVRFYPSGRITVIDAETQHTHYEMSGIGKAVSDLTASRDRARNHILKFSSVLAACSLAALTIAIKVTNEPRDFLLILGVGTIAAVIKGTDCFGLPEAIQDYNDSSQILKAFPATVLSLEEMSSKQSSFKLPI